LNKKEIKFTDAGEETGAALLWNVIFDLHDVSMVMADNNSKIAEIHLRGDEEYCLFNFILFTLI